MMVMIAVGIVLAWALLFHFWATVVIGSALVVLLWVGLGIVALKERHAKD